MTVYINRNTGVHTYCERNGIRHCSTKSITLDEDSIVLFRNESATIGSEVYLLNGNLDEDPETMWFSSDESVVTVNRNTGLISVVGPGTSTITADSEGVTATAEVTVYFKLENITLNKQNTQVDIGESEQLTVIFDPENTTDSRTITWTSDDDSTVSVDENGVITANKKGKATITAESANGKKATCEVEVLVPISKIEFDDSTYTIARSTKKKLTLTVEPANTTDTYSDWSSSDTEVATVDNYGTVTAKKVGNSVITVTTSRGVTAECTVNVNSPATSIELSKKNIALFAGKDYTLTATLAPYDVTDKVTWTTSDPAVATVENGKVIAHTKGNAIITATADSGIFDTCEVTVESDVNNTDVFLEYSEVEYDATAHEPTVEVYFNNELLVKDTDYRVEYDDNTDVGEATVTVYSLKDNTAVEKHFTITPVDILKCEIRYYSAMTYTGEELDCIEEITFNSVKLVKGTDYTTSFRDNTNVGSAKVSISGKGNFTGSTLKSFTINEKSIENATVTLSKNTYTYDGKEKKPEATVKDGAKRLVADRDYTVEYINNSNAGNPVVKVTGNLILGDTDGDGNISITDCTRIQRDIAQITRLPESMKSAADIDRDGLICILDATLIQQWLVNLKVNYPISSPLDNNPIIESTSAPPVTSTTQPSIPSTNPSETQSDPNAKQICVSGVTFDVSKIKTSYSLTDSNCAKGITLILIPKSDILISFLLLL